MDFDRGWVTLTGASLAYVCDVKKIGNLGPTFKKKTRKISGNEETTYKKHVGKSCHQRAYLVSCLDT